MVGMPAELRIKKAVKNIGLVSFYRNGFFTSASDQRDFFIAQFDIRYDSWLTNLFRQKAGF